MSSVLFIALCFVNLPQYTDFSTFPYTTLFRSVATDQPRVPRGSARDDHDALQVGARLGGKVEAVESRHPRSEEHTSELHTVISYAVFCLKKKKKHNANRSSDCEINFTKSGYCD